MSDEDARIAELEREDRRWKLIVNVAMSPLFVFVGIHLLTFVGVFQLPAMHTSPTDWELTFSELVVGPESAALLIKMDNEPPGWDIAYERLVSLDPADGSMHGHVIEDRPTILLSLTPTEVWLSTHRGSEYPVAGYALPGLEPRYDMDDLFAPDPSLGEMVKCMHGDGMKGDLRVHALDGRSYRITPAEGKIERLPLEEPPLAPTLLDSKKCTYSHSGPLIDLRSCEHMRIAGEALTIRLDESGEAAYFVISRQAADGSTRWEVSSRTLWGARDEDDPFTHLRNITMHEGLILLVAEDGSGLDDVYAAAIDASMGRVVWTRTFW